eukprot:4999294-Amphidinium_carterae.1
MSRKRSSSARTMPSLSTLSTAARTSARILAQWSMHEESYQVWLQCCFHTICSNNLKLPQSHASAVLITGNAESCQLN